MTCIRNFSSFSWYNPFVSRFIRIESDRIQVDLQYSKDVQHFLKLREMQFSASLL